MKKSDLTRIQRLEADPGEPLAERLKRGALPVPAALELGSQIAQELGAAHEAGKAHRNLNPSTIRVTADGEVTVADFEAGDDAVPATSTYLSPEQVRDEPADSAADAWAFGCIVFEMLAGRSPFEGETESDRVASILKSEPDWSLLPSGLDPRVRFLLERCLDKRAASRCSDLRGVAAEFGKILAQPDAIEAPGMARWLPGAAMLVIAALVAGLLGWTFSADEDATVVQFEVLPPISVPNDFQALVPELGISADGSRVVFRGLDGAFYLRDRNDPAPRQIEFTEETAALWEPLLSPDGQDLYYVDDAATPAFFGGRGRGGRGGFPPLTVLRRIESTSTMTDPAQASTNASGSASPVTLRKVSADGGATTPLSSWPGNVMDLTWSGDDKLLFADTAGSVLTVPANGGSPATLLEAVGARYPRMLPDGDHVLYSSGASLPEEFGSLAGLANDLAAREDGPRIVVQSVMNPEDRRELWQGSRARFIPETGHIVYLGTRDPGLWAFPFDPGSLEKTGDPVQMIDGVVVDFDVSASGALVYALATGFESDESPAPVATAADETLGLFDMTGALVRRLRVTPGVYANPRVSPDGTRIAYEFVDATGRHIWIYEFDSELPRQLTTEGTNMHPVWKDNTTLTFARRGDENWGIYTQAIDVDEAVALIEAPGNQWWRPQAWSPDGTLIFVEGSEDPRSGRLMMLSPELEIDEILPTDPGASQFGADLSYDGSRLVYITDASCEDSFFGCLRAMPFPPVRGRNFEVEQGVVWATFTPDGSELLVAPLPGALTVWESDPDSFDFRAVGSRIGFDYRIARVSDQAFDVGSRDGEQFIVGVVGTEAPGQFEDEDTETLPDEPVTLQIDYIHNFSELLERRVQ